jgi:hypothetical protein
VIRKGIRVVHALFIVADVEHLAIDTPTRVVAVRQRVTENQVVRMSEVPAKHARDHEIVSAGEMQEKGKASVLDVGELQRACVGEASSVLRMNVGNHQAGKQRQSNTA